MWAIMIFVAGVVAGACGVSLVNALRLELAWWRVRFNAQLPPATPRAIARAARRNRADLRRVLPGREVGVRMVERPYVFRDNPPRMERLPSGEAFERAHRAMQATGAAPDADGETWWPLSRDDRAAASDALLCMLHHCAIVDPGHSRARALLARIAATPAGVDRG